KLEHVGVFVVLHYHLNQRDVPLLKLCREMELPSGHSERIHVFRETGYAYQGEDESFWLHPWTHCMLGQGVMPQNHHPLTRALSDADLKRLLDGVRRPIDAVVAKMPSHQQFLDSYCKAPASAWEQMYARARQHARVTGKVAGVG